MADRNIIFDYDGTLHNCNIIYAPAFRQAVGSLEEEGLLPHKDYTDQEISSWLGWSVKDMWEAFAPGLASDKVAKASKMIGDAMLLGVKEGRARLYPGVREMLSTLKNDGCRLIFLSNCKNEYMTAHREQFELDRWFDAFYCGEDYNWKAKHDIFNTISQEHPGKYIVIGDRFHDLEIARVHRLKSIGCGFGYGSMEELKTADIVVEQPVDIVKAVKELGF